VSRFALKIPVLKPSTETVSTVETVGDIFDHDNGIWTDELFE
jgi:hypothetical protein